MRLGVPRQAPKMTETQAPRGCLAAALCCLWPKNHKDVLRRNTVYKSPSSFDSLPLPLSIPCPLSIINILFRFLQASVSLSRRV